MAAGEWLARVSMCVWARGRGGGRWAEREVAVEADYKVDQGPDPSHLSEFLQSDTQHLLLLT